MPTSTQRSLAWLHAAALSLVVVAGIGAGSSHAQDPAPQQPVAEDAEAGQAEAMAIPSKNLFEIIRSGGKLMVPILLCSFLFVVFLFERTLALRRGRVIPGPFVKRFLHQLHEGKLNQEQALELCNENRSPVASVFEAAVRKWGRPTAQVEQSVLDAGERAVNGLRRHLRVFNGVATVSPLLGLLGTVVGMIRAFNDIASSQAMGRPELLAAGISQALLTTAAGLSVAIPALIAYMYFVSRVDRLIIQIDALGQEVVGVVSAEAQTASKGKSSSSRRSAAA